MVYQMVVPVGEKEILEEQPNYLSRFLEIELECNPNVN